MKQICKMGSVQKIVSILVALALWECAARKLNQRVLLSSPLEVAKSMTLLLKDPSCWKSVLFSVEHILTGFFLAFFLAILLAKISYHFHFLEIFMWPYMQVIKATPVASVIILCLVWVESKNLSVMISFFMVMPVIYYNMLTGMKMKNQKLLEMAKVNHIPWYYRFFVIDLLEMRGPLTASVSTGIAMAYKSGIAAEVIGTPAGSIGKMLYQAKIYLCTSEMMAWTVIIILCSVLFEKLLQLMINGMYLVIRKWVS